jgi:hypothetical protein
MSRRVRRFALLGGTFVAALSLGQTALAATQTGTTGTTGAHSLSDTQAHPGVICVYYYGNNGSDSYFQNKHIWVNAPHVKAIPGMGSEKVGWRFSVQRKDIGLGGSSPWKTTYTSPTWTAMTNSSTNAAFSQQGVKVHVPYDFGSDAGSIYRVNVKLFWYKANGTDVKGTASERMTWYDLREEENDTAKKGNCDDYQLVE